MVRWFIDRSPGRGMPSVSLRRLLAEATFLGGRDCDVSGFSSDAATIEPGQVFVALRGAGGDGHDAVGLAMERGAASVVVERPCPGADRPQVVVPDTRVAHARLCHALAGDPAARLDVVGVAGSREAEMVGAMLRAIFERAGEGFGGIAADGWSDGLSAFPAGPGPLDAPGMAAMLASMAGRGCSGAVVALDQGTLERPVVEGVEFAGAVLTGVRSASDEDPDARDACRRAYARLARRVRPGGFVVVDEDDADSEILGAVNLDAERVSIGIDRPADLRAEVMLVGPLGARFRMIGLGMDAIVALRSGDLDTVRQSLAAAAVARARGASEAAIVAGLESVEDRPEEAERVDEGQPFAVVVDGARTPDDLARALAEARPSRPGRLICVIGAEGHGERPERCRLAEAAEAGADVVVFTSDNPRGEDPRRILDELIAGTRRPGRARVEPDRRRAIEAALGRGRPRRRRPDRRQGPPDVPDHRRSRRPLRRRGCRRPLAPRRVCRPPADVGLSDRFGSGSGVPACLLLHPSIP